MIVSTLGAGALASSGAVIIDFEGFSDGDPLTPADGWIPSVPNNFPNAPFTWVREYDTGDGLSKGGAVGGFFDAPPVNSYTTTVSAGSPASDGRASFDLVIFDSTNDFPDRDIFGFSVNDANGLSFVRVELRPVTQSATPASIGDPPGLWQVVYGFRGGPLLNSNIALSESTLYEMYVSLRGTDVLFGFGVDRSDNQFVGIPTGYSPQTEFISGISFNWRTTDGSLNYGDNFILFDNIIVVPEPSSFLLLGLGGVSLLTLRRRAA